MEKEQEVTEPITLQQQPKVFGAPPPMQKSNKNKRVTKKSAIPKKKAPTTSKTPTLIVCKAGNDPTPYERQPLNLKEQRREMPKRSQKPQVEDEDEENVEVLTTNNIIDAYDEDVEETPKPITKNKKDKKQGLSRKKKPSPARKGSKSKQEDVKKIEVVDDDDDNEIYENEEQNPENQRKSVNIISKPQEEDEEARQFEEQQSLQENQLNYVNDANEEHNIDNENGEQNSGEKHRRRKRRHHSHRTEEQQQDEQENEENANENSTLNSPSKQEDYGENQEDMEQTPNRRRHHRGHDSVLDDDVDQKNDEPQEDASALFENLVDDLMKCSDSAISKLAQWQKVILNNLIPLEYQQLQRWYIHTVAYLEQQKIVYDSQNLKFAKNLEELVNVLLEKHRFSTTAGASHRMRVLISGPRNSGKSTLLGLAAERAILELAASGEWKHTFIFAYDFASNAHTVQAYDELFRSIVRATFSGLSAQRPLLSEHSAGLCNCFCNIIEGKPLIPKSFQISNDFRTLVPQLHQLIQLISECWAEEDKSSFITNALSFPLQISKIFGFDRVLVIADHFDAFSSGDALEDIFIMENVKNLLELSSFIAAVQDQEKAAEAVKPGPKDGIDLTQSVFRISTLDIVEDDDYAEREFALQIEGDAKKININAGFFGGCPAFLKYWDELNEIADQVEKDELEEEEDDDEEIIEKREERRIMLSNKATEILNMLTEGQTEFNVTSVNKVHKK